MSDRLKEILTVLMDVAFKVKGSEALPLYKALEEEFKLADQAKKVEESKKATDAK